MTLYDADRCPYCARVRIVLAEKGLEYETVVIDLDDRPEWLYEKNPLGKVPVLEEDGFVLPESAVIMEYLEERHPDPPLLPADAAGRALARLAVEQFESRLGTDYYALRRGQEEARPRLDGRLRALAETLKAGRFLGGREYGFADIAYLPWLLRAPVVLGVELDPYPALVEWVERLSQRPAVARELEVVAALAA